MITGATQAGQEDGLHVDASMACCQLQICSTSPSKTYERRPQLPLLSSTAAWHQVSEEVRHGHRHNGIPISEPPAGGHALTACKGDKDVCRINMLHTKC